MEIICKGKTLEEKNWFGCCSNCKSKIKAKQEELIIKNFWIWKKWVGKCPVCSRYMTFYPESDSWYDDLTI